MDNYIGRMLDNRYEILEVIGMGGMAVVYKARCHRLNRLVAIKVLKDEYSQDAEFRRRFHAESQAVAMLSHPNIVSVYDVSHSSNTDYIVMELIDGITLKQYMEQKIQLGWRETLHFSSQIAKALEHAHSRGIIHRDIKPHNIMILKDGSVKVADFGIARITSAQSTLTREALGSVHYISPEQARGSRVDKRSDLYSLGVVMYEMLTGRTPFDGESPVAVAIQHISGKPVMPRELNPTIPEGLEQITMHAMCAALDQRYESATELLADLEEFRKNPNTVFDFTVPEVSDKTHVLQTISEADIARAERERPQSRRPAEPSHTTPGPRERERRSKSSRLAVAAGVIAVLLAVFGIFYFLWSTFLKDVLTPVEELLVPQFVGQRYESVSGNENYAAFALEPSWVHDEADEGLIIAQSPEDGSPVKEGARVTLTVSLGPETDEPVLMPPLAGQNVSDADAQLRAMNFTPQVNREYNESVALDHVISTEPAAGTALQEGQIVILRVSDGPEEKKLKVPSLTGLPLERALEKLKQEGFTAEPSVGQAESDLPKDTVTFQSLDAGVEVSPDTVINLLISDGPPEEEDPPEENPPPEEDPPAEEPPTDPEPSTDPPGGEPQTPAPAPGVRTLSGIELPQDRATVVVTVTVDGVHCGEPMTYDTSLGTIDITVQGTGMQDVVVYFDAVRAYSETVDFGS